MAVVKVAFWVADDPFAPAQRGTSRRGRQQPKFNAKLMADSVKMSTEKKYGKRRSTSDWAKLGAKLGQQLKRNNGTGPYSSYPHDVLLAGPVGSNSTPTLVYKAGSPLNGSTISQLVRSKRMEIAAGKAAAKRAPGVKAKTYTSAAASAKADLGA